MRVTLRHARRRAVCLLAVLVSVFGVTAAISFVAASPAQAWVVRGGAHDPYGRVRYIQPAAGGLRLIGFAIDPDAPTSNVRVAALIDGNLAHVSALTSVSRPRVTNKFHAGPTPAYDITVPVPSGAHTVCLAAQNIVAGMWTVLRCIATPLGTTVSSTDLSRHNPSGAMTSVVARGGRLWVSGWASDPDFVQRRATAVLYVDGRSVATVISQSTPSPRPAGSGPRSGWVAEASIGSAAHLACVYIVNVGFGYNRSLGCHAFDSRGGASTGALPAPALNAQVLAEALKHQGQRYVWAATGPKTFDCSGLVRYSYGKFHYTTPRVAADQFAAARMIPASRAVPGDLVFTHDSTGNVYHVGVYVSPGLAFAAIDEAEGVDYQRIWDPTSTTYGSFTHI